MRGGRRHIDTLHRGWFSFGVNPHLVSASDLALQESFLLGTLPPSAFDHRAHVVLAYAFLAQSGVDAAFGRLRAGLHDYLRAQQIDAAKYHETLTRAWLLAVWHFMQRTPQTSSAGDFIARHPLLLDSGIMLTHYSSQRLFSSEARRRFVEPDLEPIPQQ